MSRNKLLLVLVLLAAVAAFFWFDLGRFLSLDELKRRQTEFRALYEARPWAVAGAFFAAYVVITALSLPGAVIMTLAAGALFGLAVGALIASFASSIGATLAFLSSRYLLRDAVASRFGERLQEIDRGVARDGAFYLVTLRLVPLIPFFIINLAMGLTGMRVVVFYAASQLGMLAGTLVYVNAGTRLAQIDSLSGVLSLPVLGSFVLLGLFPLLARFALGVVQRRKVYAPWAHARPKRFDRNLVVIGAGSAGLVTAYIAAVVKSSVTLVESRRMGGDCLNTGCVPSKALIKTAALRKQMADAARYGLEPVDAGFDFAKVMDRVARTIREVEPHDSVERYTALGVDVVQGTARIVDPWTVEIDNDGTKRRLTTRSIVVATGAAPTIPGLPGLEEVGYLTSETLWELRELPQRLLILGGGPIGCELAQAFARLGSQVTLVQRADRLMVREDSEVSAFVRQALEADGVRVLTTHRAVCCERETDATAAAPAARNLVVESGGVESRIGFDRLLCAVGRTARLEGFGLQELGIACGRTIETDDFLRTKFPNILAAGDVAGPYQFTHVAAHQAWYAAVNGLFGDFKRFKADYRVVPSVTFVDPEVARVGLNEQEATERGIAYEVTRFPLRDLDRAITESAAEGFVKLLTAPGKDRILGATIVGQRAGDVLAEFVLAMKHGLGLNRILGTIHPYPTWAEANKYAAGEWKRNHQPERLLDWVRRFHDWRRG